MLFNSYIFIFAFLPCSLLIYHGLRKVGSVRGAIIALTLLSLFFYGWWNPVYLLLLVPLMLANYGVAKCIMPRDNKRPRGAKLMLIMGLAGNLAVLAYFKYANFFVDNLSALTGGDYFLATVILPLGISFFTFQKIAFLVDAYHGKIHHLNLVNFLLFVSFFPQLIAGPIVHHSELLPQFRQKDAIPAWQIMMGITLFAMGLAKKVLLADNAALYASPPFLAAAKGEMVDFFTAWSGALAYTAQLYFDFSGYSDMAIGIALLFGIMLPVNFDSPYKATSIIDFWRRWHITLSRFLRDYLYISLGGNRHGNVRRYANLFITMILGGLWHGANWTFIIWGALHGFYLVVNHLWQALRKNLGWEPKTTSVIGRRLAHLLTFVAVVVAWVFFRAADTNAAFIMLRAMSGINGVTMPTSLHTESMTGLAVAMVLLLITWLAPNTQQLLRYSSPASSYASEDKHISQEATAKWRPNAIWAVLGGCLLALAIMSLSSVSEFLYFQF